MNRNPGVFAKVAPKAEGVQGLQARWSCTKLKQVHNVHVALRLSGLRFTLQT